MYSDLAIQAGACCAIGEIDGISQVDDPAVEVLRLYNERRMDAPFIIFSQAGRGVRYGLKLAAWIRKNDLGNVLDAGPKTNPNSGRPVRVFLWTPNYRRLKVLARKQELKDDAEEERRYWGGK